jgi:hypothetical protein
MPRNYDTSNGLPYPRVTRIVIDYPESGVPTVDYIERTAIVDSAGTVRMLDGGGQLLRMQLPGPTETVGWVSPATGAPIPGSTTVQELLMGVTAMVRRDQLRRDGPPPAPAPAPAPEGEGEPDPAPEGEPEAP